MLQDIAPHVFNNQYFAKKPANQDYLFIIQDGNILLEQKEEEIEFPKLEDMACRYSNIESNCIFLFSIDDRNYFLVTNMKIEEDKQWRYENIHKLRAAKPMWKVFAASVGGQLQLWYENHQFCGRCASELIRHETERALFCPNCSNTVYPALSPSVIVAITNGDKLLMTKYAYGIYRNYALVAGYAEVGESLEETVRREVMEEVGLKVKNITYYKTQPWPFSGALLAGYFAELDGEDTVTLQEEELTEATWFKREDIPVNPTKISLTNEMIELFKNQRNKDV
jgi:NAD+ diphosphatase